MCALKIKSQQCSKTEYKKKKKKEKRSEWPNHTKEHSPCSNLCGKHLFCTMYFFTFLHTIPLRMMKCSQGINQKKCILFFWESSRLTQHTLLSNGEETQPIHILMLATTSWVIHSCAFLFVLYIFWWARMINCRSLLYWGVWEVPLSCHRLPGLPSQIWWVPFFFYFFILLLNPLFLFTAKTYLICAVPSQTPYLHPGPSTSTMQLFVNLPLVALIESHGIFNESAPETARHWWFQIYLTIKAPFGRFDTGFQDGRVCLQTSRVKFCCHVCVSHHTEQTASDFTSVIRAKV